MDERTRTVRSSGFLPTWVLPSGTEAYCCLEVANKPSAGHLCFDRRSKETRAFPADLLRAARRKVLYLHDAALLSDLRCKGCYSIRINDQWRVVFRFEAGNASDVRVVDYHQA